MKHKRKSFTNIAVKPGSNSFYEISAVLASLAKSDTILYSRPWNDPDPEMLPNP